MRRQLPVPKALISLTDPPGVVWLIVFAVTMVLSSCGRERTNPIDPLFTGNDTLSPPGNVIATGGIDRITLEWETVISEELAGYGVWRSTDPTKGFRRLSGELNDSLITTARTTFVDTTVDPSAARIYYYRLSSISIDGRASALSLFVSGELLSDTRPPAAPSELAAALDLVTPRRILLSWMAPLSDSDGNALTGLAGYQVFRSTLTTTSFLKIAEVDGSASTSYVDTSGASVTLYHYTVAAVDSAGNVGPQSASASVTTPEWDLSAPASVAASGGIRQVTVNWSANSESLLTGYRVLRLADAQSTTALATFETVQTTLVDSPLASGLTFVYRVQALGADVESPLSQFAAATVAADNRAPGTVPNVGSRLASPLSIEVTWSAPVADIGSAPLTGLSRYRIYRAVGSQAAGFTAIAVVDSTQFSFTDSGLDAGTSFFYRVSAVDGDGNESVQSTSVSQTTNAIEPPAGVTAVADDSPTVLVSWTAPPVFTSFRVERRVIGSNSSGTFSLVTAGLFDTSYSDTTVSHATAYVYRVVTELGGQLSAPSTEVPVAVPSAP